MAQCRFLTFEQAIMSAWRQDNKAKPSPAEVLTIIQFLFGNVPGVRCTLCQAMTRVDLQTGNFVVQGKNKCHLRKNP